MGYKQNQQIKKKILLVLSRVQFGLIPKKKKIQHRPISSTFFLWFFIVSFNKNYVNAKVKNLR